MFILLLNIPLKKTQFIQTPPLIVPPLIMSTACFDPGVLALVTTDVFFFILADRKEKENIN